MLRRVFSAEVRLSPCLDDDWGVGWVVERCREAFDVLGLPVRVHRDGPESSFVQDLRAADVDVVEVSTSDVQRATGRFIDAINVRGLAHLGQPSLTAALESAVLSTSAQGAVSWSQRGSDSDISVLQSVTVALTGVFVDDVVGDALGQLFV
jgi:hypothetical protein